LPKRSWFAKAGDWLLALKWIRATKRITAIILTLGSAILIALVLALVVRGLFANTISIRAITVPKALEERGFTAEVAAQRLRDAMTEYVRGANARMQGTDIELRSDEPNIVLPAVNLSLDTVISALRTFFRSSARRNISGDITDSESKLWLRLPLNGIVQQNLSLYRGKAERRTSKKIEVLVPEHVNLGNPIRSRFPAERLLRTPDLDRSCSFLLYRMIPLRSQNHLVIA
jgi:hypothetical protein